MKVDLAGAIEIIQKILQQANASIAREEREDACVDLNDRVEDWKSLRTDAFGELVLFGTFTVLKGDGGGKDQEKEVCAPDIFLLLSCYLPMLSNCHSKVSADRLPVSTISISSNVYCSAARM